MKNIRPVTRALLTAGGVIAAAAPAISRFLSGLLAVSLLATIKVPETLNKTTLEEYLNRRFVPTTAVPSQNAPG